MNVAAGMEPKMGAGGDEFKEEREGKEREEEEGKKNGWLSLKKNCLFSNENVTPLNTSYKTVINNELTPISFFSIWNE